MTEQTQTPPTAPVGGAPAGDTLLQVTGLVRHFPVTGAVFGQGRPRYKPWTVSTCR